LRISRRDHPDGHVVAAALKRLLWEGAALSNTHQNIAELAS